MNQTMPITLQEAVIDGLTRLMALRLRGSPAAENVQQTAAVWIAAMTSRPIAWDAEKDRERVQRAFIDLAATIDRWPAPAEFLAIMQPRRQQLSLPGPRDKDMSPTTRKMVDDLLKRLRSPRSQA